MPGYEIPVPFTPGRHLNETLNLGTKNDIRLIRLIRMIRIFFS